MAYDPDKPHRRSVRMPHYNYAGAGLYFITICAAKRGNLFGRIENGKVQLHLFGRIIEQEWLRSAELRNEIELDEWMVMPGHFHAIVTFTFGSEEAAEAGISRRKQSLSSLVAGFKGAVTREISAMRGTKTEVWQRSFYDRVIRTEEELFNTRRYIQENPHRWHQP